MLSSRLVLSCCLLVLTCCTTPEPAPACQAGIIIPSDGDAAQTIAIPANIQRYLELTIRHSRGSLVMNHYPHGPIKASFLHEGECYEWLGDSRLLGNAQGWGLTEEFNLPDYSHLGEAAQRAATIQFIEQLDQKLAAEAQKDYSKEEVLANPFGCSVSTLNEERMRNILINSPQPLQVYRISSGEPIRGEYSDFISGADGEAILIGELSPQALAELNTCPRVPFEPGPGLDYGTQLIIIDEQGHHLALSIAPDKSEGINGLYKADQLWDSLWNLLRQNSKINSYAAQMFQSCFGSRWKNGEVTSD